MCQNQDRCRPNDATVGKDLAAVIEQHDPIAKPIPPLLRVADDDLLTSATRVFRWRAVRLMLAHDNHSWCGRS
jgi:hypothetical protein